MILLNYVDRLGCAIVIVNLRKLFYFARILNINVTYVNVRTLITDVQIVVNVALKITTLLH